MSSHTTELTMQDATAYASPLRLWVSLFNGLLTVHAVVLFIIMVMTVSSDVVNEFNFIAQKSCHVFLVLIGSRIAMLTLHKRDLELSRKGDYYDFWILFFILICITLLIVDMVFFFIYTYPNVRDCAEIAPVPYNTTPVPIYCYTHDQKINYYITTAVRAVHIILEILLIIVTAIMRNSSSGDQLVYTTLNEYDDNKREKKL